MCDKKGYVVFPVAQGWGYDGDHIESEEEIFAELSTGRRSLQIGASDRIGGEPLQRPISPKDIAATVYDFLGLDPFQDYMSRERRSLKMLDGGRIIHELL